MSRNGIEAHESVALAIAELAEYDREIIDQVEGVLLLAGGKDEQITPARVAHETDFERQDASNLFRQLADAGAISCRSRASSITQSSYAVSGNGVRRYLNAARSAIEYIEAYQRRQPPQTVAQPIVTFPDDPAFESASPADFGMMQLMSTLATEIKRAEESIVLLAPFFEGEGVGHLIDVLEDALERGVDLTIVTRYLQDMDSHNRKVIGEVMEKLGGRGLSGQIQLIDYTVWNDDIPLARRSQDGANPSFTLHAKLMLFDDNAVYIGSANITDYGFDRYLEAGVLVRGPPVQQFSELCDFLLHSEAATEVSM